jgi:hypothetical protein
MVCMNSLNVKAWLGLLFLAVVMGRLLFVTAGTLRYWQGGVFLAVFVGASLLTMVYLEKRDPALLQRRLAGGPTAEKETKQKIIMLLASIGFVGLLNVPALGHRFGWSTAPLPAVIAGNILVAVGFAIVFRVLKENTFTSARIEIANDESFRPGPMPLCATRNMPDRSFIFSGCRSRSARIGACWCSYR